MCCRLWLVESCWKYSKWIQKCQQLSLKVKVNEPSISTQWAKICTLMIFSVALEVQNVGDVWLRLGTKPTWRFRKLLVILGWKGLRNYVLLADRLHLFGHYDRVQTRCKGLWQNHAISIGLLSPASLLVLRDTNTTKWLLMIYLKGLKEMEFSLCNDLFSYNTKYILCIFSCSVSSDWGDNGKAQNFHKKIPANFHCWQKFNRSLQRFTPLFPWTGFVFSNWVGATDTTIQCYSTSIILDGFFVFFWFFVGGGVPFMNTSQCKTNG